MSEGYESVALVKNEVFVYRIPPVGAGGYRAADWNLGEPNWTGRLRLVVVSGNLELKLEDKSTGQLFAKAPVDAYPGTAIEPVQDSSRYFVIKLVNDNGQTAFIGMGFADRSDSFDFNVALQDHFKYAAKEAQLKEEEANAALDPGPKLDLAFKEGQTITINIGNKSGGTSRPRPAAAAGGPVPLLPPPPGSARSK